MRQIKPHEVNVHNTFTWALWIGIGTAFWIVTFVVSNAIPIFSSVLNISAAIFISWFTFGLTSLLFFFLNWKVKTSSPRKITLTVLNCGIILMTVFLMIGGTLLLSTLLVRCRRLTFEQDCIRRLRRCWIFTMRRIRS
jgi:hypothetical protein